MAKKTSKGEKQEMKKIRYIGISLALITTLVLGIIIGRAQVFGSTIYIMGGIYPGAPTYTVWRDGVTYYAKDCWGQVDFSGTNCTYVVKSCLDAMISGVTLGSSTYFGVLRFAKGLFEFDTQVMMVRNLGAGLKEGLIIEGEGRYATTLKAVGAHPVFNFTAKSQADRFESFTIRSLEFTSDAAARSVGNHALIFKNATFCNIYDCYFDACYDSAIYMEDRDGNFIHDNGIYHSYGSGISIYKASDTHIYSNSIYGCELYGIDLVESAFSEVSGNTIAQSGNDGVRLYSVYKSTIFGNTGIYGNGGDGISVSLCENVTISSNNIFSNGVLGAGMGMGIRIDDSNRTLVNANRIYDDASPQLQEYGIGELATTTSSNYNIISNCNTYGCIEAAAACGIKMAVAEGSSTSRVTDSYNGTTWIDTWGSG